MFLGSLFLFLLVVVFACGSVFCIKKDLHSGSHTSLKKAYFVLIKATVVNTATVVRAVKMLKMLKMLKAVKNDKSCIVFIP